MANKKPTKSQKHPDEEIEEIEEDDESPAPEEVPDEGAENEEGDGEPVPPAGSHTITIEGGGTTPIIGVDGKVRTVARGEEIEVDDDELAYLKQADLPFKKGKKK